MLEAFLHCRGKKKLMYTRQEILHCRWFTAEVMSARLSYRTYIVLLLNKLKSLMLFIQQHLISALSVLHT